MLLSIQVVCAETEEKAREMRKFIDYIFVQLEKGNANNFGDLDYIKNYSFQPFEEKIILRNSGRVISGTPDYVKEQLIKLADDFDVNEIIITTMAFDYEARRKSFELLAEAFELNKNVSIINN